MLHSVIVNDCLTKGVCLFHFNYMYNNVGMERNWDRMKIKCWQNVHEVLRCFKSFASKTEYLLSCIAN